MHPIEKLIRISYKTFSNSFKSSKYIPSEDCVIQQNSSSPSASPPSPVHVPQFQPLVEALTNCTAGNLNLFESMASLRKNLLRAPVTHIQLCENKFFTLGIFILHPNSRIPLHDHPGMYGMLRVIHGEVRINCYTAITPIVDGSLETTHESHLLSSESLPTVLTPEANNYHEIEYVRGESGNDFAAFIDILSPPYLSISRTQPDCSYYKINRIVKEGDEAGTNPQVVELITCPSPREYYCNDAPYKGPVLENILIEEEQRFANQ